ncbi:MAG: response regulator [Candidatus Marinimicrobia bacterium]|nr:response regulator [Candidatus Neomarinimicrobiota bacterium]
MDLSINILIMDDDEAVRFSLFSYLEDCGYNVMTSDTAEDALQKLKSEKIDVVIVDLRLPGMDGDIFIESTYKDYPNLGYIIYTGSTEFTVSEKIINLPQVHEEIFFKPVSDISLIEDAINQIAKVVKKI